MIKLSRKSYCCMTLTNFEKVRDAQLKSYSYSNNSDIESSYLANKLVILKI